MRDVPDLLILAGALVLALGIGAIVTAAAGPVAGAGAAAIGVGLELVAGGVLLDVERARVDRERSRRGETPHLAGADK